MTKPSEGMIGSYVCHMESGKWFNVSTIERSDSTMYAMRFSETIVWEWDAEKKERGEMIYQYGGSRRCLNVHFNTCRSLFDTGLPFTDADDND